MLQQLQLFSEELQYLVRPHIPEDIVSVQRGLLLFRQNMVDKKKEETDAITATVQDLTPYQVRLDLSMPIHSTCSCQQEHVCRHKLAVFFSSYSSIGSVSEWIQSWKNDSSSNERVRSSLHLQKATELWQSDKPIDNTYESWKGFMKENFQEQIGAHISQPSYSLMTKWDMYLQHVKAKMPIETEWKLLYLFIMYFHTTACTIQCFQQPSISGNARHFLQRELEEVMEELFYTMNQLTRVSRPFAFDQFFLGIRDDLTQMLDENGPHSSATINIYRNIWTTVLREKTWRNEELNRLLAIAEENHDGLHVQYVIALIHLSLLTNRDEQVAQLLQVLHPQDYPLLMYWVRHTDEQKVAPFITFITKNVLQYFQHETSYYARKEFVQFFLPYIKKYYAHTKKMELFEKFCETCLPYSFMYYSNYLLDSNKHRKWVELYLYSNIELDYIASDDIKKVQQENPTLLLPLFTNIVNEKIANKNRQSYRAAVRYLKKIRTIYKKEHNLEQWERYIEKIQHTHRRLRAFQEELKRGKLIHAE